MTNGHLKDGVRFTFQTPILNKPHKYLFLGFFFTIVQDILMLLLEYILSVKNELKFIKVAFFSIL